MSEARHSTWQIEQINDAKNALRSRTRRKRKHLSAAAREEAARNVNTLLDHALQPYQTIAAYIPFGWEIGLSPALHNCLDQGKKVLVPRLGPALSRCWAWLTDIDDLQESAPGRPLEPKTPPMPADAIAQADIVLLPALAVDRLGTRLGQGGGWYDRVLQYVERDIPIVAICYDDEFYEEDCPLPCLDHDRKVTTAVTPLRVLHVGDQAMRAK